MQKLVLENLGCDLLKGFAAVKAKVHMAALLLVAVHLRRDVLTGLAAVKVVMDIAANPGSTN